jgi:hypothetical protein
MKRLVVLAAGAALLSAGCTHDGISSLRTSLGGDAARPGVPVAGTKLPEGVPQPSPQLAERVELVGWKVIEQNTFTGLDPSKVRFMTVGVKESVLFHRGTEELVISEGLVEKCQTDAELAAVLCAEMGKMVAEKRAARAVRRDVAPVPDETFGAGPTPGGSPFDAGQQASLAFHQRQFPRGTGAAAKAEAADAGAVARDLLKGAGYSPAELDRVEPLLKPSKRGEELRKQMGGSAPAPTWVK